MKTHTIPVIFACTSLFAFCVSQTLLNIESDFSVTFKAIGFSLLLLCLLAARKIKRDALLLFPIAAILLINHYTSYNSQAATEELLRFLFPIVILLAISSNDNFSVIKNTAKFVVALTISNNIYQLYFYLAYTVGLPTIAEPFFDMGYIIRAEGWAGSFGLFGLMNFLSFLLVRHGSIFEQKNRYLEIFFIAFALLSTTTKVIAAFLVYIAATQKTKSGLRLSLYAAALVFVAVSMQPKILMDFIDSIDGKIYAYILHGESARSDSYRVMKDSILSPNLLGEGLGSFGGPSSIKFHSPLYDKYNFNWYGLNLSTTDTFYPHLFVELGLIGGLLYLLFLFKYGQRNRSVLWWVIAVAFLIDNLSSFSMLAPPNFFVTAIVLTYFSQRPIQQANSIR